LDPTLLPSIEPATGRTPPAAWTPPLELMRPEPRRSTSELHWS